jgi:23S rRNA (uracil1939-C5)-methyltransferase
VRALVASLGRPARAVELYAGAGNFSVLLAPLADELITVESVGPACVAARENLAARGLKAKVVEADAATYDWPSSTSLVVLDPPRTGAKAVCDRLLASRVRHVVYVSCDPGTLRRDLELLSSSYDVTHAESVEMFPNTHHVESIVVLQRRRSPDRSQGQGKAS